MRELVAKLSGKQNEKDPINIHAVVFWSTLVFWAVAGTYLFITTLR